jgi:hypothetical protein
MMRKRIAILTLVIFCIALFAAAAHYHGAAGPQSYCIICHLSSLSFEAENSNIHICQSWTRSTGPSLAVIIFPDAPLARLEARAPPA